MQTIHPATEALRREYQLEQEMHNRGRDRFLVNLSRLREQGNEGGTSYGKTLLRRGIEPLAEALRVYTEVAGAGNAGRRQQAAAVLCDIPPDVAAFITLRTIIDTLTAAPLLQTVAVRVGRELETELRLGNLAERDADRYAMTQRWIAGHKSRKYRNTVLRYAYGKSVTVDFEPWPATTCLHVGQKCIELAAEHTGLVSIELTPGKIRKGNRHLAAYHIVPTPRLREWIDGDCEARAVMSPDWMPTLVPPRPWEGASGGGYHHPALPPLSLVKTHDRDYLTALDARIRAGELPEVLRAVNALQATPWRINRKVYDVLHALWMHGDGGVADLPPRDGYRLPPCPVCGADITDTASARIPHACLETCDEATRKTWRRQAAVIREKNIACLSQRLGIAKTLRLAARYKDEAAFYFPYQLDFRGRIYAVPPYLNPQGAPVAKALLEFAAGKPLGRINALRWLAIHTANCFGNDKVSLDERGAWALQHQAEMLACADAPLSNRWWMEADDPWGFLACCFEWQGYKRDGLKHVSHLPVAMDGSCNGLQLYSLILRDEVGGQAVNLTPTETPQDIYGIVAEKVRERLRGVADSAGEMVFTADGQRLLYQTARLSRFLLGLGIDRKTTKRQVMVLPYGGTMDSCREYTELWLKARLYASTTPLSLPDGTSVRAAARFLAEHIWEAIGATVVKAREAMSYLQAVARLTNRAGQPLRWTSPLGLPVVQAYREQRGKRVKTRIGDSIVYVSLREEQPRTLAKGRQQTAIAPNFIHSLDAAALMRTVCRCLGDGIAAFAMIHDSYGTLAADSDALAYHLREAFVELFGGPENLLARWSREVLHDVPVAVLREENALPPLPSFGSLDVTGVRHAPCFFA